MKRIFVQKFRDAPDVSAKVAVEAYRKGATIGYMTAGGSLAILTRLHDRYCRGSELHNYGFIVLPSPRNAPVFQAGRAVLAIEAAANAGRDLLLFETVAELAEAMSGRQ